MDDGTSNTCLIENEHPICHILNRPYANLSLSKRADVVQCINSDNFWRVYHIIKSASDGHCFVHSLVTCLRDQSYYLDSNHILRAISDECITNCSKYLPYMGGISQQSFFKEKNEYVHEKLYNSNFGDIVPIICANALMINIIIISYENPTHNFYIIGAEHSNVFAYVYKNGNHYDGLKFSNSQNEILNSNLCYESPGTESHTDYLFKKASSQNTHCKTTVIENHTESINVCSWNIHGLDDIKLNELGSYFQKFDIILLNETWSSGHDNFQLDNFKFIVDGYRKNKHPLAIRNSGGIGVFVHDKLVKGIKVHLVYKDIITWLILDRNFFALLNDIYVCCLYFPPERSACINDDLFSVLQNHIAAINANADIIICGDLNARCNSVSDIENLYEGSDKLVTEHEEYFKSYDNDFLEYLRAEGCYHRSSMDVGPINQHGRELLQMCRTTGLVIVNGRRGYDKHIGNFTYVDTAGKSLVDYVVASPNVFRNIENFKLSNKFPESDHLPINFTIATGQQPNTNSEDSNDILHLSCWHDIYKYTWCESDLANLKTLLESDHECEFHHKLFLDGISQLNEVDNVASLYSNYVLQACNRVFERKKLNCRNSVKRPKWYDNNCKSLRVKALAAGERVLNDSDQVICVEACKQYRNYKQFKRRQYYHECLDRIENTYNNNRSDLWNLLSYLSPDLSTSKTPSEDKFFTYFTVNSKPIHNTNFDYSYEKQACLYLKSGLQIKNVYPFDPKLDLLNKNISVEEILECIHSLKNNKSPGIDGIPAEIIKYNSDLVAKDIAILFNYFLENREFPKAWTEGIRNPIFKGGSRLNPSNYRGITVLPVFEKLFETIVHRRLDFIDEAFNFKDIHNSGFQKGCRTVDNLAILQGIVERQLILNQNVFVIFVDFKKAFDMINRNILFYKVNKMGLHGRLIDTLYNLYRKTSFRVKLNGKYSDQIEEFIGVNQGGNASPTLFKKYLQDLSEYIQSYTGACINDDFIQHVLWADDLILISTTQTHSQLQLNGLSKFCKPNQMLVNNIKTKCMVFGKQLPTKLVFDGNIVEKVDSNKALGIIVNSISTISGNMFRLHPEYLYEQARKAYFGIQRRVKYIGEIPPKHMIYLYESMIQPILLYGSELWGHNQKAGQVVDKMYLHIARNILKVKQNTSNLITIGEFGLFPPSLLCQISSIIYAIRLLSMNNDSLVKKVFKETRNFENLGFNNWWFKVVTLANLYNINLLEYSFCDLTKRSIKSTMKKKFCKSWQDDINNTEFHPILRTYRLYKKSFNMEPYLISVNNSNFRNALSKIRCSSHDLAIEKGRHSKPKTAIQNRLCFYCNVLEDEIHFICKCPLYDSERNYLFDLVESKVSDFPSLDDKEKFIFLLSCDNQQILTNLGKFIYKSFIKRSLSLNNS